MNTSTRAVLAYPPNHRPSCRGSQIPGDGPACARGLQVESPQLPALAERQARGAGKLVASIQFRD